MTCLPALCEPGISQMTVFISAPRGLVCSAVDRPEKLCPQDEKKDGGTRAYGNKMLGAGRQGTGPHNRPAMSIQYTCPLVEKRAEMVTSSLGLITLQLAI